MEKHEQYLSKAKEYVLRQMRFNDEFEGEDLEHLIRLAASVMMTRDNYMQGGQFVQSVVDNNLSGAIGRADNVALRGLRILTLVNMWCKL